MAIGNNGGRPRKPTALLVLQGDPHKGRIAAQRKDEPPMTDDGSLPPCPEDLPEDVQAAWDELASRVQFKIFSAEDVFIFKELAQQYAINKKCMAHVSEHGVACTSETADGRIVRKVSPEAAMLQESTGKMITLLTQLGMTPSSRSKVKLKKGGEKLEQTNPDDEFKTA